jgi:FixJ family two-component response regulator
MGESGARRLMTGEPTVFVVDDDASVLRALTWLLGFEFVVQA